MASLCRWPPGQRYPALADQRVVAAGQAVDEVMELRDRRRGDDLLVRCVVDAVGDVSPDRRREDEHVLLDDAHVGPERRQGHVPDVGAVDCDGSARDVVEAGDGVHDRGLAGARPPEDGDELPRPRLEVYVLDGGVVLTVTQGDTVELHVAPRPGHRPGAGPLGHRRDGVETSNIRWPAAEARVKVLTIHPAIRTGICMMAHQQNERGELALRQPSIDDLVAADEKDRADGQREDEGHERAVGGEQRVAAVGQVGDEARLLVELVLFVLSAAERLDDAYAGEALLEDGGQIPGLLLNPHPGRPQLAGHGEGAPHYDRHEGHADQAQPASWWPTSTRPATPMVRNIERP